MARCAIGIDLGTSNCALEWCDLKLKENSSSSSGNDHTVSTFKIRQYEAKDRVVESEVLPSFIYFHGDEDSQDPYHVGIYARESLKEFPARCIHSAKSWLCHSGVDRESAILPWQSEQVGAPQKLSPIDASAAYLRYLKASWDTVFRDRGPGYAFSKQQVTVTVPASFDQVAQRLTLEAAKAAGFPETTRLLEEPQAAFLAWIQDTENRRQLEELQSKKGKDSLSIVVCDVGGGTTDFSLFRVNASSDTPDPDIERVAVSDHILLGGDNIDMALAKRAEAELIEQGVSVKPEQWLQLVAQCRLAKESALGGSNAEKIRIVMTDTGSSIFANTRSLEWSRCEVESWILERFFPRCERGSVAKKELGGLVELGLPYAREAAVTVHLSEFLSEQCIDAILFNGGTVSDQSIQNRICDVVAGWQTEHGSPVIFSNDSPYLAVARGAAYYGGRLRAQADSLIRAGSSRPFLVEVQASEKSRERHLLCLVPKGATAADTFTIKKPTFALRLNRPVQFQPFSGPDSDSIRQGQIVKWKPDQFNAMPPLQTLALSGEKLVLDSKDVSKEVILKAGMNELGLIDVSCIAAQKVKKGRGRWDLAFDMRQVLASENQLASTEKEDSGFIEKSEKFREILKSNFSERVLKDLEESTSEKRGKWQIPLLRVGFDSLLEAVSSRSQSESHEIGWWMAAGYCMRPGFGAPLDDYRIQQLDALLDLDLGYPNSKSVREQYAVFWRRVAGGMDASLQTRIFDMMKGLAFSGTKKGLEPLKALAAMERVAPENKEALGKYLVESMQSAPRWARETYLWCLGRVCARVPLISGPENVVSPKTVGPWVEAFLSMKGLDVLKPHLRSFVVQSSRLSGSRELDLSLKSRELIQSRALELGVAESDLLPLKKFIPVARADRQSQFGEALPQGLVLI